jgi:hypothetical protein
MLIVVLIFVFRSPSRVLIRPLTLAVILGARHRLLFGCSKEEASADSGQQETD